MAGRAWRRVALDRQSRDALESSLRIECYREHTVNYRLSCGFTFASSIPRNEHMNELVAIGGHFPSALIIPFQLLRW